MIQYFQTTALILLWCFGISIVWSFIVYKLIARKGFIAKPVTAYSQFVLVPALVLGPACLVVGYKIFHVNLLFPVQFFADFFDMASAAFLPAVVLLVASGLLYLLTNGLRQEFHHWQGKSFSKVAEALGKDVPRSLRRLVILKSFTQAWSEALPWLFGELLVVECVFNAPGLGLEAWHFARTEDVHGLLLALFWLMALYGICVVLNSRVYRWIGIRLESY